MTWTELVAGQPAYAGELAGLRRRHAAELDPHSTLEVLPTADDLERALATEYPTAIALRGDECVGYGLVHGWVEDDQTAVRLLDVWAVPGSRRAEVEAELFADLESAVHQAAADGVVLGANSRSDEPARARVLSELGYRLTFSMSELEWDRVRRVLSWPPGVTVRDAVPSDAEPVAGLLARAWSGRAYSNVPDQERVGRWLDRAEPGLFLIAEEGSKPIGLASAVIARQAEIDDVGVDPAAQRRGIGAALVTELLGRLSRRTALPVRLHTESHDPAGALRLYRRLGFVEVGRHDRWRKHMSSA